MVSLPARAAEAGGRGAGGFLGGFFNNPGVVIIAGVGIALFLFRDRISEAFGSLGESIGGIGSIEFPDITLPTFNFPAIEFPDITFPSFGDITFPDFGAGFAGIGETITQAFDDISKTFVPEERQDVPLGDTGQIIDVVPDVTGGRADRLDNVIGLTPAQIFGIEERGLRDPRLDLEPSDAELFARDFPEVFTTRQTSILADPIPEIPFAVANVEETQAEFQERSGAFAEAFPDITRSTSLPGGDIIFGTQLSRNQEDFQSILDAEARRSESIFSALFGNVQNPDF